MLNNASGFPLQNSWLAMILYVYKFSKDIMFAVFVGNLSSTKILKQS